MTTTMLLEVLAARGVRIRAVGDRLRLSPASALTPELVKEARQHKLELLRLVADQPLLEGVDPPAEQGQVSDSISAPAECPLCGGVVAPFLIVRSGGSRAVLCTGCHAWLVVGDATQ